MTQREERGMPKYVGIANRENWLMINKDLHINGSSTRSQPVEIIHSTNTVLSEMKFG